MSPLYRATCRLVCFILAVAAALGISGNGASATDVNFFSNTSAQQFNNDCAILHTVASLNFSIPANREIVVLFNAECSVAAADDDTSVNISLRVDNVLLEPTNNFNNFFCTSTGDNSLQHWVSAETNGARLVTGVGTHTVLAQGRLQGCTTTDDWQIDDVSLIVIESP